MAHLPAPRKTASFGVAIAAALAFAMAQWPVAAEQETPRSAAAVTTARPCRIRGTVESGDMALPGVSVNLRDGDRVVAVTSTDVDGTFTMPAAPGNYTVKIDLSAFASVERPVTLGSPPCEAVVDAKLSLVSRVPGYVAPPPAPPAAAGRGTVAGGAPAAAAGGRGFGGPGGRAGGGRFGGANRFQALTVEQSAGAAATPETGPDVVVAGGGDDPAARLLPPGFSLSAPQESVTVNGSMVEVDRNQLIDRTQALARGDFGLADGQQVGVTQVGLGQVGDLFGGGAAGGAGGGRGGGGGPGLGGRGVGAARTQVSATYGFGGSMFDAAPYPLNGEATTTPQYLQQNFSTTIGGALKIPHVYNGTNRTTYNFSYTGSHNDNLFDQYAIVPTAALRAGDFSAIPTSIIDPQTGLPFPGNQIPQNRIDKAALDLLQYIPTPNVTGGTGIGNNYHIADTTLSRSDQFSLRITHSITKPQTGRGGRGGPGGGAGGRGGAGGAAGAAGRGTPQGTGTTATTPAGGTQAGAGGQTPAQPAGGQTAAGTRGGQPTGQAGAAGGQTGQGGGGRGQGGQQGPGGGRGGRGNFQPPLNVTMTAAINYRRNSGDRANIYPLLSGRIQGSTLSVPVTLNIRAGRSIHAISATFSRTTSETLNNFAFRQDIAGQAGIQGVSTDPFDWGVPSLSFGTFTSLRDTAPSLRKDHSLLLSYGWTRPSGSHTYRFGGSYQQQLTDTRSDANARGTFTFSGLYTAQGQAVRNSGQDFADFLLGLPQQATRQFSGTPQNIAQSVSISGRNFNLYVQDDWRWKARWTINYGVQYDFVAPFTETSGKMVNLDANADFTAVATVAPGQVGPYSGLYPAGLVNPDWNNVAPRVGVAWRANSKSVVRFGYGLSYNSGSYATIARNLYQQPPVFQTGTSLGTLASPLPLTNAFANIAASTITNNYGIDKNYQLGLIDQWTVDYSRDLFKTWSTGATYIGTLGSHLDMLRAPNRGPSGLRIPDVQSFTWQSSDGSSHMNGVSLRLQKRQSHGVSGTATYTLSKSRDNTTATSGNATVAQNDQDLNAEWALSNFDRRHQFNGTGNLELPFGRNRHWFNTGGWFAALVGDWTMSATLTVQSGTPLTIRCAACASDVGQGVVGTLRADYLGGPIQLANPTSTMFFNTGAFAIPAAGTFGSSGRNILTGPGSHLLNAQFTRDLALGQNRNVSINVVVNNLLNTVNYAGINTDVGSGSFGYVTSVNSRRTARVNVRFRF